MLQLIFGLNEVLPIVVVSIFVRVDKTIVEHTSNGTLKNETVFVRAAGRKWGKIGTFSNIGEAAASKTTTTTTNPHT